ncbi:MAG: NADPH-dependent 7-cyano-7-deazaguanine reductase QueF [Burkholderiales bacterium]|nr:NADPH-dependent 7-cyano-7-deazaguanine reductase QueF [Burkholderiales bacterium]
MASPEAPLGREVPCPERYDPTLLFPIARDEGRARLALAGALPFTGVDVWNAYELSWLGPKGKPEVALATVSVPCESPAIVESKSFKLYLNAFSQTVFADAAAVRAAIARDVGAACGAPVSVVLASAAAPLEARPLEGESLDAVDVAIADYLPNPALLAARGEAVEETLVSDLLKSNCPVTGQPDWASVQVRYRGPRIDRAGLLAYVVSFRGHADFHEHCVERIFVDIAARCRPERLSVYARYTRRGGLDINPFRTNWEPAAPPNVRTPRQ